MTTLESVYDRAVDARSRCKRRLLLQPEVQILVKELWDELEALYPSGSEQWRIIDRSKREHTNWWSVPTMSQYVKDEDCGNIEVIVKTIEEVRGKPERKPYMPIAPKKRTSSDRVKQLSDPSITGRTIWDILEKYTEPHGKKIFLLPVLVFVLFFIYVHYQTPSGKSVTILGIDLYTKHGT